MKTRVTQTPLLDLLIIDIDFYKDERGFFIETWHKKNFAEVGIPYDFVQDSHSASTYGVLRGLHYQDMTAPMAKLVRCTVGKILDVVVDLRPSSPTYCKAFTIVLSAENKKQLFVPIGFAHGFATVSDYCEVQYKQTEFYRPEAEGGIAWNDPTLSIEWPYSDPILSLKDQRQQTLTAYRSKPAFK